MIKGKIFTVPYRRKREGRTHYKKRLKILLSRKYRFVVRKSLKNLQASIIQYSPKGDKVVITINTKHLNTFGWKADTGNLPSAYLIGYIAGKKALEKGIKEAVFDMGLSNSVKGSRLYATLAGALDSGMNIPHNQEVLPSMDRISGEHIMKHAQSLKKDTAVYIKQFSRYMKRGLAPEDIVKHFNETKDRING